MAIKEYEIKADTSEAVASVEALKNTIDETGKSVDAVSQKQEEASKKATKTTREQQKEERDLAQAKKEVIGEIDRATGGYIKLGEKAFKAFKLIKLGVTDAVGKVKEWRAAFSIQSLIMQAVSSIKLFGQTLKLAFTNGAAAAKVLRVALISTGIGALVVAVGALVAYWDDIKGAISGATVELTKNKELAEQNAKAQQEALDAISLQENSLKLQGKSEKEIRDLKIQQTDETIKALEAQLLAQKQLQKSQVEAANRNKQILQGILEFITLPLKVLLETIDAVASSLGKESDLSGKFYGSIASLVFDPEEVKTEGEEAIKETENQLAKLKSTRDGYLLDEKKEKEAAAKAAAEKAKEASDKELKAAQEAAKRLADAKAQAAENARNHELEMQKQFDEKVLQQQESAEQQEINATLDKFFALEQFYADNAEMLAMITEQREKELLDINNKYRQKEKDEADKAAELKMKRQQELRDLIVDSANATIENLLRLNDIYDKDDEQAARRAFERGKKLQLLQAVINTAAGIIGQLAVPQDQLTGANWAKAAVIAATGATQIATISAQKFDGGNKDSASSPSAPQIPSVQPSFNIVGQSGTNQLLESIAGQFQNPVRAYVVNGEVMSGAELERKRIRTATFG
jgi:hypothetical protein